MKKEYVDVDEIWEKEDTGIEGKKIGKRLLAVFANGYPIMLRKNYAIARLKLTKEELENLKGNINILED